jgi:hypothetical protein
MEEEGSVFGELVQRLVWEGEEPPGEAAACERSEMRCATQASWRPMTAIVSVPAAAGMGAGGAAAAGVKAAVATRSARRELAVGWCCCATDVAGQPAANRAASSNTRSCASTPE